MTYILRLTAWTSTTEYLHTVSCQFGRRVGQIESVRQNVLKLTAILSIWHQYGEMVALYVNYEIVR